MKADNIKLNHTLDRDIYQDLFLETMEKVNLLNEYGWAKEYYAGYENDIFYIKSFHWGDCTCGGDDTEFTSPELHDSECLIYKPNFIYKPTNFIISWYKHPLRGNTCNRKTNLVEFKNMMNGIIKSCENVKFLGEQ